jgi:hypothetical protein
MNVREEVPEGRSTAAASWPAIIAGAFVAAAVSLALFALGSGLGLASVSPWKNQGLSATTFAVSAAIWLIVMQWVSAAAGGYVAGRLRARWIGTHDHEVFFRDTAHGFVTWAVATVVVAALISSSAFSALSGIAHVTSGATAATIPAATASNPDPYTLDRLFRPADPGAATPGTDPKPEAAHIIAAALTGNGAVSDPDRTYLATLVAARTGVPTTEAQTRVNELITAANEAATKARAAADAARKVAAQGALFTALALVVGAFIACLSAVLGGRIRDQHL